MVSFCCITKLPKTWWLKTVFHFSVLGKRRGDVSADLNWDWRTLCVCFYLADLGWALDILGLVGSRLL